jgi:hypothetical protein
MRNITDKDREKMYSLCYDEERGDKEVADLLGLGRSTVNDFRHRKGRGNKLWWDKKESESEVNITTEDLNLEREGDDLVARLQKRVRHLEKTNNDLRRVGRNVQDYSLNTETFLKAIKGAVRDLLRETKPAPALEKMTWEDNDGEAVIYEILFSDYQIGKLGQYYNSELAEKAMQKFSSEVLGRIKKIDKKPKKIILACLGDNIEDHMQHGVQSAVAKDCPSSQKLALAIKHIWQYLIKPLAELGVTLEVPCVPGNHGSSQHKGMDNFKAGLYSYDYTIYSTLKDFCKEMGLDNVKFHITTGVFAYCDIFGRRAVYSHGYTHGCSERDLEKERATRSNQMKKHVEYYRCGDMHHVCAYDNYRLVVNGAFFGVDTVGEEYSGVLGFSSIPAQVMMVHKDDQSLGRNTVKEAYVIQVADGY